MTSTHGVFASAWRVSPSNVAPPPPPPHLRLHRSRLGLARCAATKAATAHRAQPKLPREGRELGRRLFSVWTAGRGSWRKNVRWPSYDSAYGWQRGFKFVVCAVQCHAYDTWTLGVGCPIIPQVRAFIAGTVCVFDCFTIFISRVLNISTVVVVLADIRDV